MTHQKQAFVSSLARTRALGALSVTTLALAACGGGSGSSASAPAGATTPSPVAQVPTPHVPEPTLEPVITPTPVVLPTPGAGPVQAPPPSQQVPTGVNLSNPGVLVKPVAATALSESGANTAMAAIDGSGTTRWESSASNNNWIQFDFGAKTAIGYLKIVWENAYGKEYALQTSDDGQTWYQVRYVVGGKGGVEEFFNLNANVRYVRTAGRGARHAVRLFLFEVDVQVPRQRQLAADPGHLGARRSRRTAMAVSHCLRRRIRSRPSSSRCPTAPWSRAGAWWAVRAMRASAAKTGTRSATAQTRRSMPPATRATRDLART